MCQRIAYSVVVTCLAFLIGGCAPERLGFGQGATATPVATPATTAAMTSTPVPVPTFTPSPLPPPGAPSATPGQIVLVPTATPAVEQTQGVTTTTILTQTGGVTATLGVTEPVAATVGEDATANLLPTPTLTPSTVAADDAARVTVNVEAANVRSGPSTDYAVVGAVVAGEQYPLTGRNGPGDWWQICCFADQPGWIYGPLVEVENADLVAEVTDLPPLPEQPTPSPVAEAVPGEPVPDAPAIEPPVAAPTPPPAEAPPATDTSAQGDTAGNFDPNAQYQIVHYRVLGFDDNNGGIFNKGGQQLIFVTVLDQNGNGVDGAMVKDAVGDKLNVVTGSKGPGKAEIKMDWDPYKLYVAADPSGAVTSQVSNQMNNPYPHIPDVVGMLGPPENEYAICPTVDDRCTPPFYHAHWSYEITFQRVK